MIVSTAYLDFSRAKTVTGGYDFGYNIYQAVKSATAVFILNNVSVQSTPCIVSRRASGTYVLTYSSTSFYITTAKATTLLSADPDT